MLAQKLSEVTSILSVYLWSQTQVLGMTSMEHSFKKSKLFPTCDYFIVFFNVLIIKIVIIIKHLHFECY